MSINQTIQLKSFSCEKITGFLIYKTNQINEDIKLEINTFLQLNIFGIKLFIPHSRVNTQSKILILVSQKI